MSMETKQMAALLTTHGVRPTQQRMAVYSYLLEHCTHPSADTVYNALVEAHPTFSRTTVYNSLHTLVNAGLVRELALGGEEKRYDGGMALHGHFRCTHCGSIRDVHLEEADVARLCPPDLEVHGQDISFFGRCPDCM